MPWIVVLQFSGCDYSVLNVGCIPPHGLPSKGMIEKTYHLVNGMFMLKSISIQQSLDKEIAPVKIRKCPQFLLKAADGLLECHLLK